MHAPRRPWILAAALAGALAAGCKKSSTDSAGPNAGTGTGGPNATTSAGTGASGSNSSSIATGDGAAPALDIDSKVLLARTDVAASVQVKHVLLAWKELAPVYERRPGGKLDPRAAARTNADAAKLAQDVLAKLQADPKQIDALIQQYSEDPGSLQGKPYTVTAASQFVPEFKALSLRLKENEAGIVKTVFGYHVIERVAPPPPDPLESADILARTTAETGTVYVQHVLIGWKDLPAAPPGSLATKADADALAKQVFDKVKAGEDMKALMKQYSEDPGSKDTGEAYPVTPDSQMVDEFKNLSLRLKEGEAGMVISMFGWHVIKRVPPPPPPPPDPLDSTDILARKPVTDHAKVKHILLGWTDANAGDPRGTKRSRAELDALVKKTVADLKKGAKIEDLMKQLSEDPGSATSGDSYPVTPDAQLVDPFKNLSLRLNVGEVGVVKSQFGIHIIQRVE